MAKSGYKGVYKTKEGRWKAELDMGDRKRKYLGTFDSPEEANEVYSKAKFEHDVKRLQEVAHGLGYRILIEGIS